MLAVFRRRPARVLAEDRRHVMDVGKPGHGGDLLDRQIGRGDQESEPLIRPNR